MTTPMLDLRGVEMSLAYERAAGVIESHCTTYETDDDDLETWYDLSTAEIEMDEEVAYLESRGLLLRSNVQPNFVMICDEGEPLGAISIPERKRNERGFAIYVELQDRYGAQVRVVESSLAGECCVWVFCHGGSLDQPCPHLTLDQAREVIAGLQAFVDDQEAR